MTALPPIPDIELVLVKRSATDPKQSMEPKEITIDNKALTGAILSIVLMAGCATTPTSTQTQDLKTEASQEAAPNDYSIIEICTDFSEIAKFIMTARQKDRPMSQTLPTAMARVKNWVNKYEFEPDDEVATGLVMHAYERPSWNYSDGLKKDEISEFENEAFRGCYDGLTSD